MSRTRSIPGARTGLLGADGGTTGSPNGLSGRAANERLLLFTDSLPIALLTCDDAGRIISAVGRGLREAGLRPEALVGRPAQDVFAGCEPALEALRSSLAGNDADALLCVGDRYWASTWTPLRDAGRVTGIAAVGMNVTDRVAAEAAYRHLVDAAAEGIWMLDAEGRTVLVNAAMAEMLRMPCEDVTALVPLDVVSPEASPAARDLALGRVEELSAAGDVPLTRPDGTGFVARFRVTRVHDGHGAVTGSLALVTDVTSDRRRESQQTAVARLSAGALAERDLDAIIAVAASTCLEQLTACSVLVARPSADGAEVVVQAGAQATGSTPAVRLHLNYVLDAGAALVVDDLAGPGSVGTPPRSALAVPLRGRSSVLGAMAVYCHRPGAFDSQDLAFAEAVANLLGACMQRAHAEDQISHQERHDALTGLPNRLAFVQALQMALDRRRVEPASLAVLIADLDGFKLVNDAWGDGAGDALLGLVALRLQDAFPPPAVLARLGGDEFGVLHVDGDECDGAALAARISRVLDEPFVLDSAHVFATASVGVALADGDRDTATDLLCNADAAMHRAKHRRRGGAEAFESGMRVDAGSRLALVSALRRGVDEGELRLHYQPEIDLRSGRVVAAEALLRWQHPLLGLLGPDRFMAEAEASGVVVRLGEWALRTAAAQAVEWRRRWPHLALRVAVNLSTRQLEHPELIAAVADVLAHTGLDPALLVLEVTESAAMTDPASAVALLQQLRGLGVGLAIDDFGTGYSSLLYLRRLPVDVLKIDRQFVDGVAEAGEDRAIVAATVSLAHSLGLATVAEGIETPAQLRVLEQLGCDLGQGYLLSRPLDGAAFSEWVAAAETVRWLEAPTGQPLSSTA